MACGRIPIGDRCIDERAFLETAARSLKVMIIPAPVRNDVEIEAAIIALGREPGGGLAVMPDAWTNVHRVPIIGGNRGYH
jgi:hypothetical protein